MSASTTKVAIIGAGPYGLSLAAQLRARGVSFRIFGPPMESWSSHMPAGMHLKSDGFASNLYDAHGRFTLEQFCAQRGIEYDHRRIPVLLEHFVEYGLAFQAAMVPSLENHRVVSVRRDGNAFEIKLDNAQTLRAERVVVASGIAHLGQIPPLLESLGPTLCKHSSEHHDLTPLKGKRVVVVGGGSSATDVAALLHEGGAHVQIVSRHPVVYSVGPGKTEPSLWQRIRRPHLGLGSSFRSAVYTVFPNLFHYLPRRRRLRIVKQHLGPHAGYFMRPRIVGKITVHEGYSIKEARATDSGAQLLFVNKEGKRLELVADHVIAATGYKPAVARLPFLDKALLAGIQVEDQSPILSRMFESTEPGLYFAGLLAANSFGPLLRFALGARFCAGRLASHLDRVAGRSAEPVSVAHAEQPPA